MTARRKSSTSPASRTLAECRKRGWIAEVVERKLTRFITKDFLNVIDIIAIDGARIIGIQTTTGANHASRRGKILAEERVHAWLAAGGHLELWTWRQGGERGKRKVWMLRVETWDEMQSGVARGTESSP
jgi:hypothetical protein